MATSARKARQIAVLSWGRGIPGLSCWSALPQLIEPSRMCLPLSTEPMRSTSDGWGAACLSVEDMDFGFATMRK